MLSKEMAIKLKETGLEWEPQRHDIYLRLYNQGCPTEYRRKQTITDDFWEMIDDDIFYPSLSQLLAEIEKRGYIWAVDVLAYNEKIQGNAVSVSKSFEWENEKEFRADSPEDAAAQALLWILKEGAWT